MTKITAERFANAVGRKSVDDDLERCNCPVAGSPGHFMCGWNSMANQPEFLVSSRMRDGDTTFTIAMQTMVDA